MNESTGFDYKGQRINVGLDVHKKSWTMSIYDKSMHLKRLTVPPDPEKLSAYLKRMYPLAQYHVAYEAVKTISGVAKARGTDTGFW